MVSAPQRQQEKPHFLTMASAVPFSLMAALELVTVFLTFLMTKQTKKLAKTYFKKEKLYYDSQMKGCHWGEGMMA